MVFLDIDSRYGRLWFFCILKGFIFFLIAGVFFRRLRVLICWFFVRRGSLFMRACSSSSFLSTVWIFVESFLYFENWFWNTVL